MAPHAATPTVAAWLGGGVAPVEQAVTALAGAWAEAEMSSPPSGRQQA
ncbi:MAG: hypothetical protein M3N98_10860 [Actinomycetota bacterium]|nr:hypothetical protein [Actinomycetota bacterium]